MARLAIVLRQNGGDLTKESLVFSEAKAVRIRAYALEQHPTNAATGQPNTSDEAVNELFSNMLKTLVSNVTRRELDKQVAALAIDEIAV